jgi:RimJ/RimL family protein N-acetyltransferase
MLLRDVTPDDLDAYVRMRCDPVMMRDLGGPLPREGMREKVERDVRDAVRDTAWTKMIVPDPADPGTVAGTVTLWSHDDGGQRISEIGWMVLPAHQGRGHGKRAVRALLDLAAEDGRWGLVHAFPAVGNAPSNGICRTLGFTLAGQRTVTFADRLLHTNHWTIDPRPGPA